MDKEKTKEWYLSRSIHLENYKHDIKKLFYYGKSDIKKKDSPIIQETSKQMYPNQFYLPGKTEI